MKKNVLITGLTGQEVAYFAEFLLEKGYWLNVHSNLQITPSTPIVAVENRFYRPMKINEKLGWTPKATFYGLVAEMVHEDLKTAERDELHIYSDYKAMDYHE